MRLPHYLFDAVAKYAMKYAIDETITAAMKSRHTIATSKKTTRKVPQPAAPCLVEAFVVVGFVLDAGVVLFVAGLVGFVALGVCG